MITTLLLLLLLIIVGRRFDEEMADGVGGREGSGEMTARRIISESDLACTRISRFITGEG